MSDNRDIPLEVEYFPDMGKVVDGSTVKVAALPGGRMALYVGIEGLPVQVKVIFKNRTAFDAMIAALTHARDLRWPEKS